MYIYIYIGLFRNKWKLILFDLEPRFKIKKKNLEIFGWFYHRGTLFFLLKVAGDKRFYNRATIVALNFE